MSRPERFACRTALALLLALSLALLCYPLDDRDVWTHLRTGRLIVETRSIPRTDPYSYTAAGAQWVYPSWLAAVAMHGAYELGGIEAVQLLAALVNVAALALMLALLWRQGVGPLAMVVAGALLARVVAIRGAPRPYVFTHLLLAASVGVWAAYHERGRRPWLLVPIMALWANLHAAFVAGGLLLAPQCAAGLWLRWRCERTVGWGLLGLCAAAGAATLLNPYGWGAVVHPLRVTGIGPVLSTISEWRAPGLEPAARPFWQFVAATVLAACVALARGWRPRLADALSAATFFALALTAARHVALCAIVATPLLGDALRHALRGAWLECPRRRVAALLVACVCIAALTFDALGSGRGRLGLEPRCHPVQGVEFVLREGIHGRMLNEFGKGGYILWRAFPRLKVFIDGRLSVYGGRILEDWRTLTWMRPGWRYLLDRYDIDFILGDNRLDRGYYELPGWRLVYWDDVSRVLVKATPARRALIERCDCALTCPDTFDARRLERYGLLGRALVQLEAKVKAQPECLAARLELGDSYAVVARYAAAAAQFRAAVALDPNAPDACGKLGECLERLGRSSEAAAWLRRADWLARRAGLDAQPPEGLQPSGGFWGGFRDQMNRFTSDISALPR